jgi:hypothetical protein
MASYAGDQKHFSREPVPTSLLCLSFRHARLASLLNKLCNNICPESLMTLSPEKTHPLAITGTNAAELSMNKVKIGTLS